MNLEKNNLFDSVRQIIVEARQQVYRATNTALLKMYWEIGKLIIEDEQQGKSRAEYGKAVLQVLIPILNRNTKITKIINISQAMNSNDDSMIVNYLM